MEQQRQVPPRRETQSPSARKKAEALQAARRVANEKRTLGALAEGLIPKRDHKPPSQEERERLKKGERLPYKRVLLSEEERHQRAKNYLTAVNQRPPSAADYVAGATYYGLSEADQREYERAIDAVLAGLAEEDTKPFFDALGQFGPRLLLNPELNAFVEGCWLAQLDDNTPVAVQNKAKQFLERIGATLSIGSGRTREVTADVAQQIIAIYAEEYARCCVVRKLGKGQWKTSQERHRQIGKRLNISPHEASSLEAEGHHFKPSEWARERTAKRTGYSEEIVRPTLRSHRSLTS